VTTSQETAQPAACPRRLFLPTTDARLIAINADNGKVCEDFGDHGTVDLSIGMGEIKPGYYQQTSTPLVAGNVVVVGGRVADNFSTGEPRAWYVRMTFTPVSWPGRGIRVIRT
jgi:quinate dehydrogenase (quinone)